MTITAVLSGCLELRSDAFGLRYGLIQAPREVYGLPSDGPDLVLGALRVRRADFPALFDPELLQSPVDTFDAHVWPVASSTAPAPLPPLDTVPALCLIVTTRHHQSPGSHHNPKEQLRFSATPRVLVHKNSKSWLCAVPGLPLDVPVSCAIPLRSSRRSRTFTGSLVLMTGMRPEHTDERLWIRAAPLPEPTSHAKGGSKKTKNGKPARPENGSANADRTSRYAASTDEPAIA